MTAKVERLVSLVNQVLGDFEKDRHGYGAAHQMLDWPLRASLKVAVLEVEDELKAKVE